MKLELGQIVYHNKIYWGTEPMKIVGLRENSVELEGDYSGGTHNVCQRSWMSMDGVLLERAGEPFLDKIATSQSAVKWLYHELFPKQLDGFSEDEWKKIDTAFEKAEKIFEKQIVAAADLPKAKQWYDDRLYSSCGEQHYKETYEDKDSR